MRVVKQKEEAKQRKERYYTMGGGGSKEAFKSSITDLINNQQVSRVR